MAAPTKTIIRRPKGSARRSLTAASQVIDDPAKAFKSPTGVITSGVTDWQNEAWELLCVGELRYYVSWRASSCGRVKLVASEIGDDGLPTGGIAEDNREGQRVNDIVNAIAGGRLGQTQLVKRAVEHLTIPGETWIAILVRPDGEKWYALTREEIKRSARGGTTIELPGGEKHEFDKAADAMFRVWNPSPRKAADADSPVRGCLDPLREIVRSTRKIAQADNSRLIGNGILLIPSEASLPATQAPVSADKPGDSAMEPEQQQDPLSQQLQNLIVKVAETAYKDPDSMAGLVPIVAAAPGEHLKNVHHIKWDDEVTDGAIKTRNDAIARLAMGLDVSPERLLGLGKNSNHWSAWAVGDEDVQLHISPVMETICQAITASVLRVVLQREGIDPDKYVVWYDASHLTADPDKTDEAQKAWESGAINVQSYLEYLGLSVDAGYDLSTPDGLQQWALDQVTRKPELVTTFAPLISWLDGVEFPVPQPAIESGGDDPERDEEGDPQSEPDTEGDEPDEGAAVGQESQIDLAVDLVVTRALELAGKRRRTHADHDRLRAVPMHETHRFMGPVGREQIPKLIKGWDAGLDELLARYRLDPGQVRAAVLRSVQRELTSQVVDAEAI